MADLEYALNDMLVRKCTKSRAKQRGLTLNFHEKMKHLLNVDPLIMGLYSVFNFRTRHDL